MQLILRWFGPTDTVSPAHIRQVTHIDGVASALMTVDPGVVWPAEAIEERQAALAEHSLEWTVVESIPLHEDIKIGRPTRDRYIDAWCETLARVGAAGIKTVCYNFMPVFDWMRTNLEVHTFSGSLTAEFRNEDFLKLDVKKGIRKLPVWRGDFDAKSLGPRLAAYDGVDEEQLFDNLGYFLSRVVPVAREAGVKLGVHPDDPPWSIFGLPRIMTNEENLARVLSLNDDPANGLTFCTGSLGALPDNDVVGMARRFGATGRVNFAHCRNVRWTGYHSFVEAPHARSYGNVDLVETIKALVETGFDGPMRPDHGRMLWGEKAIWGYGLHDRAMGAMYLAGAWEAAGGTLEAKIKPPILKAEDCRPG